MKNSISIQTREELLTALRGRYHECPRAEKTRIIDEFVAVSGYHRKHAIRLLATQERIETAKPKRSRIIYDEAVREAIVVIWEAADRICGKRLKVVLSDFLCALEQHGHLNLDDEIRDRVLAISASTIDRLLKPIRSQAGSRRKRRRTTKISKKVPIRTFADWHDPAPGHLEIDFVLHGGNSVAGSFIHTLVATDVSSGWTDFIPLLAREQSLVVEGLNVLFGYIPFPILSLNSDNDSAFINDTLLEFCENREIKFTRSRPHQSNDQAWIEQKNGAVIRRMVGYERFSGVVAGQALAHLYQAARFYVNFFQPSFKLNAKTRNGSKVKRIYHKPATPSARLLEHPEVDNE